MDSMNAPSPEPAPTPVEKASVWEDFLDIFYAPSKVFARRANGNFWIPLLVVTILIAALAFANRNIMRPMFDAEFARNAAATLKANPNITQAQIDRGKDFAFKISQYGSVVIVPIVILFIALVTWIVARFVDAKLSWNAALVVVCYATIPRVVQQIFISIQALFVDPTSMTSRFTIGLGPGRYANIDTLNPVLAGLYDRLDLFVLWGLLLITIGVATIGKLSKARAWAFGIGMWVLTALPTFLGVLRQR